MRGQKSYVMTRLAERFSVAYLIVMVTSVAYFLSVLIGCSDLSATLAFPAIYLAPGLMLILLTSKGRKHKFRQLIIVSFFLSTVIAVIVISTFILLGVTICSFSIATTYVLLTFILVVLAVTMGKKTQMEASRLDYAFLGISLITYASLVCLFTSMPRLFTMDETTYIAWSRYAILSGETYPVGIFSFKSDLAYLVKGRFFWTLLITSFLGSTGLEAHQAHVISTMFLPMVAIASTLLMPIKFKDNKFLQVAIFLLVLTNPLLLLFSGFALNDLAVAFYLVLAILFFIRSFNQREQDTISINLYGLLLSVLTLLIVFLIKENFVVIVAMYIILLYCILRYRLYKISKACRILLYALTLPLIVYEALIDIPYVISVWFIKNETISMLTSRFLFISPAEWFLGLFIPTPWNPTTILSYDLYGYLHYLYRMLSPETLSLLVGGIGITLPIVLALEGFRKDIQMRILVYLSTTTLWLTYLLYLSTNAFWDIPRYFLFMTPIITVIALTALHEVFFNRNISFSIALTLPMIFLTWIQSTLSIEKGGVYVSYGLSKLNWTSSIIIIQLLAYVVLIIVMSSHLTNMLKVIIIFEKRVTLDFLKILFVILMIVILLSNTYFSIYSLEKSRYFDEHGLRSIDELLDDRISANSLVFSNVYFYARPYVPESLLLHNSLFSLPMTDEEFIQFLKTLPNNTLILLSEDQNIAWHEYANRDGYIFRYMKSSKILTELKDERQIYDGVVLHLSFDSIEDCAEQQNVRVYGNATLAQGIYGNALSFDGIKDYVAVPLNYSLDNSVAFTVEAFVKPNIVPTTHQVIVSKGWNKAGAWTLQTTPHGKWEFAIKNQNGDFFSVKGGTVVANEWFHIVGVWNNSQLWLYVNGVRYGPVNTTGNIGNNYNVLIGQCELFGAGNYWNGTIDDICIYNRALSEKEILDMYSGPELLMEKGNFKLFRIDSSRVLNLSYQSNGITIESVDIRWTNSTNVRLEIKIDSERNETVLVYLDTFRFLKTFNFSILRGENNITLDFPRQFPNRDKYGIYIANWANILIVDSQGNLLYHELHTPYELNSTNIASWLSFALLLLTLLLLLLRKMVG